MWCGLGPIFYGFYTIRVGFGELPANLGLARRLRVRHAVTKVMLDDLGSHGACALALRSEIFASISNCANYGNGMDASCCWIALTQPSVAHSEAGGGVHPITVIGSLARWKKAEMRGGRAAGRSPSSDHTNCVVRYDSLRRQQRQCTQSFRYGCAL